MNVAPGTEDGRVVGTEVATLDYADATHSTHAKLHRPGDEAQATNGPMSLADRTSIALLIVLYLVQGIPMGLVFGTVPFLLKSANVSYTELGFFSLAGYPYSLKLLWSPLVDSFYWAAFGRRKSWIVPIQLVSGVLLLVASRNIEEWLAPGGMSMVTLTVLAGLLVFLTATQDIAVDGWALEMLSHRNRNYASTCQTVGLNSGYFLSFTIFMALNSVEFTNKYIRAPLGLAPSAEGLVALSSYLAFWSVVYLIVTAYVALFKREVPAADAAPAEFTVRDVYLQLWHICQLPNMRLLITVLLLSRLPFVVNDRVTALKLVEYGFKRENMALTVMLDFPFEIFIGYQAALYARGQRPLLPWIYAFVARLAMVVVSMAVVAAYPVGPDDDVPTWYLVAVVLSALATSCISTVMFVSLGAYFAVLSDPAIGGTYMTLLNTFSNLGSTWPGFFVMSAVDFFTAKSCAGAAVVASCGTPEEAQACTDSGGACTTRDGYFIVGAAAVVFGLAYWGLFLRSAVKRLEAVPESQWRIKLSNDRE